MLNRRPFADAACTVTPAKPAKTAASVARDPMVVESMKAPNPCWRRSSKRRTARPRVPTPSTLIACRLVTVRSVADTIVVSAARMSTSSVTGVMPTDANSS